VLQDSRRSQNILDRHTEILLHHATQCQSVLPKLPSVFAYIGSSQAPAALG
jgi:hypothetical protein